MLPKRLLGVCVLSSGLILSDSMLDRGLAHAQQGVIDLDEEDEEEDQAPAAPAVTAGTMSEGARSAKALFDAQKWPEAALALYGVVAGETGDDDGNKQLAQYFLSISLSHEAVPGELRAVRLHR
jgi:hypothetical protein